jgi:phage terminase large subunit
MLNCGTLFKANYEAAEEIVINQGGSSSGKTYSILQVLFAKWANEPNIVITVVGQDIPNLKAGALRDALTIWQASKELQAITHSYNRSDRIFLSKYGSIMEFKSFKDSQDAKSGKRDYSFFNEANGIPFDVFTEVRLRTRKQTFIDYNPNAEFWVHEHLIGRPNTKFIRSWHEHNPFLSQVMRDKIEGLKEVDEQLWRVYARGYTGKIEGLIFRNHNIVPEVPNDAEFICCGMDFGFTNDPSTLIEVYRYNGELYINQLLYSTGLTNQDIGNKLTELGFDRRKQIVADSAEPKSIEELRRMGFNVQPAQKGADSIRASIDILKRFTINITANSTHTKKEFMNYKWSEKDNSQPIDCFNHCIDAIRYVALNKLSSKNNGKYSFA